MTGTDLWHQDQKSEGDDKPEGESPRSLESAKVGTSDVLVLKLHTSKLEGISEKILQQFHFEKRPDGASTSGLQARSR